MKIIKPNEVDAHPKYATCETHGEYKIKFSEPMMGRVYVADCFECAAAENREREAKELADEQADQKAKLEKAWEGCGVSKRLFNKGFDDFVTDTDAKVYAKKVAIALCDDLKANRNTGSIIMNGGVGTGKTALCTCIIKELATTKRVGIIKMVDMIRNLKGTWSKNSDTTESRLIDWYVSQDLLVLDEVGMQHGSDTEKMFIFDVIDGRYQEMKPTILISNLAIAGIKDLIGERVIDRLREDGGKLVSFDWPSYRS